MGEEQSYQDFINVNHALGYTKDLYFKKLNQEDKKILHYLKKINLDRKIDLDKEFNLDNMCLKELIDVAKYYISKCFTLHDVMIEKKNSTFNIAKVNGKNLNLEWNKSLESINPYDIPIEIDGGISREVSGMAYFAPIKHDIFNNANFKFENVSIDFIMLGRDLNLLTVPTYAHEMMHAQLETKRTYTNDYQKREIIPIFVELLIANCLKTKIVDNWKMMRLYDYLHYLMDYDSRANTDRKKIENVYNFCYITSISKAIELFDNYVNASCCEKRKIIYGVQDVLDGKITIEELLEQNKIGKTPGKRLEIVKKWTR